MIRVQGISPDRPRNLALGLLQPGSRSMNRPPETTCTAQVYVEAPNGLEASIIQNGWRIETLRSPAEFLNTADIALPSCLVREMVRPDCDTLPLHSRLATSYPEIPIIVITESVDVEMAVSLMKSGSFDVLTKPIADDVLLSTIRLALQHSDTVLKRGVAMRQIKDRYASLSRRERQVMALIVAGSMNKQVGGDLGISEITVKAHRGRVMRKMRAESFAALIRMATVLGL